MSKQFVSLVLAVLCFTQPFEAVALSAPATPQMERIPASPVPQTYLQQFCASHRFEACMAFQAWSWFRSQEIYIDAGARTIMVSGTIVGAAFVARKVLGSTETIQFIMTTAQTGVKAGGIIIGGTVLAVTVGAFLSALAYIGSATPTGDYFDDKPELAVQCANVNLNYYKTVEGQQKLLTMTPEEAAQILPCIPADQDLLNGLVNGAENGKKALEQNPS